jgi:hypothetical protein
MRYPELTEIYTSREMIDVFGGYNHNLRIGSGEFYDMTNLTSDDYPVLSPRKQRGVYASPTNPVGLIAKDALCHVDCVFTEQADGARFYINGNEVEGLTLSSRAADCPKTLVSMGAYVIIMPDKKYVNTENPTDYGNIEATVTTDTTVFFSLCKIDGADYPAAVESATAPEDPQNLDLWLDTSGETHVLKQYAESSSQWVSIATTYIKITSPGSNIGKLFAEGDGITISGIDNEELADLNSTMVVWGTPDDNSIIVTGMIDTSHETNAKITLTRRMPAMDFIIESGNRLWGCRYGLSVNGEMVNEIYASKLGDFKNWNSFAGISTDSYAASLGTDGQFTGAITHLGYPLFFKENYIHKVYGNYPANYQIQTITCRGVQKGCERSLAIVNETLFYKSRASVCAYDGSLPSEVSSALGDVQYSNAVAGVLGNKYYISMMDTDGEYSLFVFDTKKGMWHREDDTQVVEFCTNKGDLFYIDYADKSIKTVRGQGTLDTSLVEWEAITGVIGTDSPDKKYISRMDVRMSLNVGTRVSIFADYDSLGSWEHLFSMTGTTLRSFAIPIRPKRCDHLRLKIMGKGEAKIFSITKTIEQGSDV